jgi:solute carrier family 25 folate transporter 32
VPRRHRVRAAVDSWRHTASRTPPRRCSHAAAASRAAARRASVLAAHARAPAPPRLTPASPLRTSQPTPQGWRGLYAGLSPALVGGTLAWGLYFACYNSAKARYAAWGAPGAELPSSAHLAAAAEAGVAVSVLTNPIWVAKTRLQLQRRVLQPGGGAAPATPQYTGLAHALRRIAADEGLRGLYRGLLPSLALVSHGALQFTAYEALKKRALARSAAADERVEAAGGAGTASPAQARHLSAGAAGAAGVASKLLASGVTYPSQVLRARLQQRSTGGAGGAGATATAAAAAAPTPGVLRTLQQLLAREGLRGLYKGWVPNVLRVLPSSALTFLVYEQVSQALERGST